LAAHAIGNVRFEVMSLDALTLPDKSVDAAISQFGFLQEGDVAASAKELARVLKDGAPFSVAAFDAMELNTLFSRAAQVLARHVPAQLLPDFDYLTGLAAPGLRERLLREAGISTLHTEMFSWQVPMASAAAVWTVIFAPIPFGRALDGLASNELALVRSELEQATAEFLYVPDGLPPVLGQQVGAYIRASAHGTAVRYAADDDCPGWLGTSRTGCSGASALAGFLSAGFPLRDGAGHPGVGSDVPRSGQAGHR
jgi:hypothetical protein